MLRLSKLADYGTVVMVFLARNSQILHNAKTIAQKTHIPAPTVSKLLKLLTHAGLLDSQRGAKGGYALSKPAENISIAATISAVEGEAGLTVCSQHTGECALEAVCSTRDNWLIINRAIHNALAGVSLAALAAPSVPEHIIDTHAMMTALGQRNNLQPNECE